MVHNCFLQERETSTQPKNEDRIKRLSDENKKLIHLVTALDQQVTVLEGKLTKGLAGDEARRREGSADLSRAEVVRIVRESLPHQEVDNTHRGNSALLTGQDPLMFPSDAQIQSLVTEVQNIIGQVREQGMQVKEQNEKIRTIERNDTNERFGIELAGALSKIETVSLN